jgi:hypothetical protein
MQAHVCPNASWNILYVVLIIASGPGSVSINLLVDVAVVRRYFDLDCQFSSSCGRSNEVTTVFTN